MPVTFNEPLSFTQVRKERVSIVLSQNYLTVDITAMLFVNVTHRDLLKILNMLSCFIRLQVRKYGLPRYNGYKCTTLPTSIECSDISETLSYLAAFSASQWVTTFSR